LKTSKKALSLILLALIILVMQPVTVCADEPSGLWQQLINSSEEPVVISRWGSWLQIDEDLYIDKDVELHCDQYIILPDNSKKTLAAGKTLKIKTYEYDGDMGNVVLSNVTAEGSGAKVIIDTSSENGNGGDITLGFFDDSGGCYPSLILNSSGGNGGSDGWISYNSALQFSSDAYTVNNGETAKVTISRTSGSAGKVRVQYSTSDGTAQAGTDYTAVSGVLEFANGESVKTFQVPTNDISGGPRTVNLILSNPDAWATLGSQATAVLTIEDNDPVCEIGTTPYYTLDEALFTISAGETKTIKLLKNIDYNGSIVITGKNVTFDLNGHTLTVTNNAGHALEVGSGGVVNLDTSNGGSFNITAVGSTKYGVYAHDGGQAIVTSATVTSSDMNSRGAMASGTGSFIHVTGDVTALGDGIAALAENGGIIEVGGKVTGGICGATASGSGSVVTIAGNSEATVSGPYNTGARAEYGATVTIGGDVISKGGRAADTYGEGSLLIIEGGVSTDYDGGAGAEAREKSTIIIKGVITAPVYLKLDDVPVNPSEGTSGTGEDAGYKIYTNHNSSTIKVKNNPPTAKTRPCQD